MVKKQADAGLKSYLLKADCKKKVITVGEAEIEVRKPTRKQFKHISSKSQKAVKDFKENDIASGLAFQIFSVIELCYEPGTNNKVFNDMDFDAMEDTPMDGPLANLISEVQEFINESVENLKKN